MITEALATARNQHGVRLWIHCGDGSCLSVIAGEHCYCTPRNSAGGWTHVEVGSWREIPGWVRYSDGEPLGLHDRIWVYSFVPLAVVEAEIATRGGAIGVQDRLDLDDGT
jgi:hypothetical protein